MKEAKPIKDLAQELGYDKSTVRRWVRAAKADTTWRKRRETGNQTELAVTEQGHCDLMNYLSRRGYVLD